MVKKAAAADPRWGDGILKRFSHRQKRGSNPPLGFGRKKEGGPPLKSSKVIDDYDKFERNIRSNERLMNRLISMKRKGISFDDPLSNRTDVQNTIKDFSLDVSYKNGKIIFDESPDKESVLNLISDYYYRTTQHKRKGIVDE